MCVNSPLRPQLPGSLAQPPAPAHTESKEARGVYSCGCKQEKGNEEYLVWKPYRRHSVNPLALYLHLLISHNILIKPRLWETARAKKWRRQRVRVIYVFSPLALLTEIPKMSVGLAEGKGKGGKKKKVFQKRHLSSNLPTLLLHTQNMQCCVHQESFWSFAAPLWGTDSDLVLLINMM